MAVISTPSASPKPTVNNPQPDQAPITSSVDVTASSSLLIDLEITGEDTQLLNASTMADRFPSLEDFSEGTLHPLHAYRPHPRNYH
jgi:hypothetical protein